MIGQHITDEPNFPDAGRNIAAGASVVMAVAAAIALVLAMLVASLSTARAAAMTGPQPVRHLILAEPMADGTGLVATGFITPTPATYRIEAVLPARDGTFTVAGPFDASHGGLAWAVLALIGLAAVAATRSAGGAIFSRIRPRRRSAGRV